MSGKGNPRRDALRVKRTKRQAEASNKAEEAPKKQKKTDHAADHEVVETVSLSGNDTEPLSGIGISEKEIPEGIIHFDNIFKDIPLDFVESVPEIEPLRCGDEGLAIHLPKQIQEKILNHQYINLALLLKGSIELSEICSGGTLHINEKGCIESRPKILRQTIHNIEEWTDAFIIFSSVYLQKFPEKITEILKYMSVIREAATRYPTNAWIKYDQQFRLRQACESTRQSWGSLNGELWLRVMSNPSQNNSGSSALRRTTGESANTPSHTNSLTCNAFNEGNCTWNICKFKHTCAACNSSLHGRSNCPHMLQRFQDGQHQSFASHGNVSFRGKGYSRGRFNFRGNNRFNRR